MHAESDYGLDNPIYDEYQAGTPTLTKSDEFEKKIENPIYSDELETSHAYYNSINKIIPGPDPQLQSTSLPEGVYSECSIEVSETLDKNTNSGVHGAHVDGTINSTGNGIQANDGVITKGATSEGVNELPPNLDDAGTSDENGYSTLNPTYSQLQAHLGVPKPGAEKQSLQNNDDYSRLQYK